MNKPQSIFTIEPFPNSNNIKPERIESDNYLNAASIYGSKFKYTGLVIVTSEINLKTMLIIEFVDNQYLARKLGENRNIKITTTIPD